MQKSELYTKCLDLKRCGQKPFTLPAVQKSFERLNYKFDKALAKTRVNVEGVFAYETPSKGYITSVYSSPPVTVISEGLFGKRHHNSYFLFRGIKDIDWRTRKYCLFADSMEETKVDLWSDLKENRPSFENIENVLDCAVPVKHFNAYFDSFFLSLIGSNNLQTNSNIPDGIGLSTALGSFAKQKDARELLRTYEKLNPFPSGNAERLFDRKTILKDDLDKTIPLTVNRGFTFSELNWVINSASIGSHKYLTSLLETKSDLNATIDYKNGLHPFSVKKEFLLDLHDYIGYTNRAIRPRFTKDAEDEIIRQKEKLVRLTMDKFSFERRKAERIANKDLKQIVNSLAKSKLVEKIDDKIIQDARELTWGVLEPHYSSNPKLLEVVELGIEEYFKKQDKISKSNKRQQSLINEIIRLLSNDEITSKEQLFQCIEDYGITKEKFERLFEALHLQGYIYYSRNQWHVTNKTVDWEEVIKKYFPK